MVKMEKKLYTATVNVKGGRDGKAVSNDGNLNLDLRYPKELGGNGAGTNPEQLFAAGFAACFEGAMGTILRKKNIKAEGITIVSNVTLGKDASDGYVLAMNMDITISGVETSVAEEIVAEAHLVCPYAKATRGNIEVVTNVVG
ncbi:osmotically inducible protein OsmC [Paenibacillus sp. V4I3]|jgi:osmotically inducible protein OsmC|uniref:organic hydroperoxide resistance protein n=1 Tax=unclassified Paenibacillus TaxID=185978 RepID=UPI00277D2310|nr:MULTISPECIES: organic hydroperoxide resistance protein [unclassified Paenibacillus]MDQ0875881.1 osmotically inducible protein OsmC [Paenibacillus sp. V4I3]MDQ0888056.1 osmotically inducible protein OsmC [Paenibacillus sp. V4I9]MDQ0899217.1 osmotically inducible protein OsmC [Paenibacillus sp. V4I7]MDQ0914793.1 osmotically inducible protein OsmC [Paenibacillus sp. V4I5]